MVGLPLPEKPNFTIALWKAILLTKSIAWVRPGGAAPSTPVWDKWLLEAEKQANSATSKGPKFEEWDAKDAWNRLNEQQNGPPAKAVVATPQTV